MSTDKNLVHLAELPWERRGSSIWKFTALMLAAATAALVLGALIDLTVTKAQKASGTTSEQCTTTTNTCNVRTRTFCALFFAIQTSVIAGVMYAAHNASPRFLPWLQISLSGFMFNVLLFISQRNLERNARCFVFF